MEDKIYKIILADGTVIDDLKLNGNNYISKDPISADIFDGSCSPVIITDGINEEVHDNMEFVQITENDDGYWLVLRDLSDEEMSKIKMQSDIEYLAMMTGVEI